MTYINFAYYYRPHGWRGYTPLKFYTRQYFRGKWKSKPAKEYLKNKTMIEWLRPVNEQKALRIAAGQSPYPTHTRNVPSWNVGRKHDRDLDMGAGL